MHDALVKQGGQAERPCTYTGASADCKVDWAGLMHLELICKKHTEHSSHPSQHRPVNWDCSASWHKHNIALSTVSSWAAVLCWAIFNCVTFSRRRYRLCSERLPDGACHALAQHACSWGQPTLLRYHPATLQQEATMPPCLAWTILMCHSVL